MHDPARQHIHVVVPKPLDKLPMLASLPPTALLYAFAKLL